MGGGVWPHHAGPEVHACTHRATRLPPTSCSTQLPIQHRRDEKAVPARLVPPRLPKSKPRTIRNVRPVRCQGGGAQGTGEQGSERGREPGLWKRLASSNCAICGRIKARSLPGRTGSADPESCPLQVPYNSRMPPLQKWASTGFIELPAAREPFAARCAREAE